ncbi:MAG: ORF6N domain-containing protein [Candidatus Omnitrophota bacterium]
MKDLVQQNIIERKIYLVRGRKVMLDSELAGLYGVETKNLNLQVRRNIRRFPEDFMFKLTKEENLRLQFATSSYGGRRYLPYVFTEQGVAMLSSILNSERAIDVNIAIMRAFVRLRDILLTHKDLAAKIATLELKYKNHDMRFSEYDKHIMAIFEAIKKLMAPPPEKPRRIIGFKQES